MSTRNRGTESGWRLAERICRSAAECQHRKPRCSAATGALCRYGPFRFSVASWTNVRTGDFVGHDFVAPLHRVCSSTCSVSDKSNQCDDVGPSQVQQFRFQVPVFGITCPSTFRRRQKYSKEVNSVFVRRLSIIIVTNCKSSHILRLLEDCINLRNRIANHVM